MKKSNSRRRALCRKHHGVSKALRKITMTLLDQLTTIALIPDQARGTVPRMITQVMKLEHVLYNDGLIESIFRRDL
jgi:hypothetical protein